MTEPAAEIRQIDWRSVFPWWILLRSTRFALAPTALAAATLGVLLTSLGWGVSERVFLGSELTSERPRIREEAASLRTWPVPVAPQFGKWEVRTDAGVLQPYRALAAPVERLFRLEAITLRELLYYTMGTLWMFAIWGAAGGVIVRSAVVRFAWEQPADPWQTVQFVAERFLSYATAPLYPLLGVALLMIPLAIAGLLARADFGLLLVSLFWFLGLLCSLAAVWLLIPLLFGFPLMWGAISAERDGDAFEALSNSIAYTYQRPLKYLGYALVVFVLGALSILLVDGTAQATVHMGYWGLSWGSGAQRALEVRELAEIGGESNNVRHAATWLMGMWTGIVYLIAAGFRYSFFWTAAAGIYLLLRKDVDDKELDEVYVPHEEPQLGPITRSMLNRPQPETAPPPASPAPLPAAPAAAEPPA